MDYFKEITARIEAYYSKLKRENPFYKAIFSGTITPTQLGSYVYNVQFSLKATIPQCKIGAEISEKSGWKKLSKYFLTKVGEETGHDQWAKADVKRIQRQFPVAQIPAGISNEMDGLIKYNYELVKRDPRLFLVYMLFAEYFTVTAGGECLEALEKLGFARKLLTVVDSHVTLDKEHVYEWNQEIKECEVNFEEIHDEVFNVLQDVMKNYDDFWTSVMEDVNESKLGNSK